MSFETLVAEAPLMDEEDAGASTPCPAHVLASLAQCRDRSGRKVRRFSLSCLVLSINLLRCGNVARASGPDETSRSFLLINFHHFCGFAASGNQSLSSVGRFMTSRCIFVVLARLAACPPDLRFLSTQANASLAKVLRQPGSCNQTDTWCCRWSGHHAGMRCRSLR